MRLTNQFKKTMLQLMKLFEYEGQGHQIKFLVLRLWNEINESVQENNAPIDEVI